MSARPLLAAVAGVAFAPAGASGEGRLALAAGWQLQSSARVRAKGDAISSPGFRAARWHAVTVPNTVVGALVENGTYPDPYFATNLRTLPGATYPLAKNFSHFPMPADSPFRRSWWYRTEFELPDSLAGRTIWAHFDGINYRADVWLNGERVAAAKDVVGAFRRHQMDVTRFARAGRRNALAVEVFAPEVTDLAYNWVDWNPMPPDKNMGLWGDVYLTDSGPLALRHPLVVSRFDGPSLDAARLTISAEVWNATERTVKGTLRGAVESVDFARAVELAPRERTTVRFTAEEVRGLRLRNPRVWWPYRLGSQETYTLSLELEAEGTVSDRRDVRFGVQETSSELTAEGHRLFKVNGRPVLVRGGGWAPDMLLRRDPRRLEAEMLYVRDMGLNAVRLEGKPESDLFYDLADRYGILVIAGWCCCDHWEQFENWDGEDRWVAAESLRDQALRLRGRPSVLAWFHGSDFPPPPDLERTYEDVLRGVEWPKPVVSSATDKPAASGPSGVKMRGPYDYVPPSYWLEDGRHGGAFGFSTEATGGMAVPPVESLRRMLPPESLWPIDEAWTFHAGGQEFAQIRRFKEALEARYGKATGVEDFARKAQALAYEGHRAMFEAFARNKYRATGVVQWMLNNAWPSLIWHLHDYYLRPGGGYFGAKKACRPLHVQYSYDDRSVVVVDDTGRGASGVKVTARVLDLALVERFSREATVEVPPDGVVRVFDLPQPPDLGATYFVRLTLEDASGKRDTNLYWLSGRRDVLEWDETTWFATPTAVHGDLTALASLSPTTLAVASRPQPGGAGDLAVTVENTGTALAFQVRLKVTEGEAGEEVLPVIWEDNYLALLPGERRELSVSFPPGATPPARPVVHAEAWNSTPAVAP